MKIICVQGLPGSGKSTLAKSLARAYDYCEVFDDLMAGSYDNSDNPVYARHLPDIFRELRDRGTIIMADNQFVLASFRKAFEEYFRWVLGPGLEIEWHVLDCRSEESVRRCRSNVKHRHLTTGRNFQDAILHIRWFKGRVTNPERCLLYEVVDAKKVSKSA